MRKFSIVGMTFVALSALTMGTGCAGATINPGHRALMFDPGNNGIQPEVIQPGWVRLSCPFWTPDDRCPRVEDYDVTYQTSNEAFHVISKEGLPMDVQIAVTYRPIVAELYLLDTEIGHHYFDKVIGPEFRNAAIGVFSKESYSDLQRLNGDIENKIQKRLQDRLKGKHLEVSSVFIQHTSYDPTILDQQQKEVVSRQELQTNKQLRANKYEEEKQRLQLQTESKELEIDAQKKLLAAETEKKKLELNAQAEQKKLEMSADLEVAKIEAEKNAQSEKARIDSELRNKQVEKKLAAEQAQIDKMKADAEAATQVAQANGESTARLALAKATAAENGASAANITPMQVEMHAYDALGKLGGTGTTIMMGDWSKLPNWLFPRVPGFQTAFAPLYLSPPFSGAAPTAGAPALGGTTLTRTNDNPYSSNGP
jgi:regulator of protease activity HflC (stomatin/prohibitin superfamily)